MGERDFSCRSLIRVVGSHDICVYVRFRMKKRANFVGGGDPDP